MFYVSFWVLAIGTVRKCPVSVGMYLWPIPMDLVEDIPRVPWTHGALRSKGAWSNMDLDLESLHSLPGWVRVLVEAWEVISSLLLIPWASLAPGNECPFTTWGNRKVEAQRGLWWQSVLSFIVCLGILWVETCLVLHALTYLSSHSLPLSVFLFCWFLFFSSSLS